jgi:hypothetical protein
VIVVAIVTAFLIAAGVLGLGSAVAANQDNPQEISAFTGVHAKHGVGGKPNITRITNGKEFRNITEEEYRQGGYAPPYERLPVLIIQRLPVVPKEKN